MKSSTGEEKDKPRDRVAVVTDPETAEGFTLGGVETYSFMDERKAKEKIRLLLRDERTKVLVVNDEFLNDIDDRDRKIIESSLPPTVIPIPAAETGLSRHRRTSLLKVIRRASPQI